MNAGDATAQIHEIGRKADDSTVLDQAVRVGILAYGTVHLLVAWVAIQLAFGERAGSASSQGALSQMAQAPLGHILLYVVAGGFAALAVWQAIEAAAGHRDEDGGKRLLKRLGSGVKVVLYGVLGWSALKIALGGGSDGGGTDTLTAKVMAMPAGQLLVGLVGVAVFAYGVGLVYQGFNESFVDKLEASGRVGNVGRTFVAFGMIGYVSKGAALFVVAGLFLWAALTHDPEKSGGLDQALNQLLQEPFGNVMLLALAAGIGCYGLFTFAWARHLDR